MAGVTVYDKVSWHYPEGKSCPSIDAAMVHFRVLMEWLHKNYLLSGEGEEVLGLGIDEHFSITSEMLTETGNDIMKGRYSNWLNTIGYDDNVDLTMLDDGLREFKTSMEGQ